MPRKAERAERNNSVALARQFFKGLYVHNQINRQISNQLACKLAPGAPYISLSASLTTVLTAATAQSPPPPRAPSPRAGPVAPPASACPPPLCDSDSPP